MNVPCYSPLDGWRHRDTGGFTTRPDLAIRDAPLTVPCGQCIGCRLERSRQWAIRIVHEGQMHEDNCFVTLTYSDDNLPPGRTLVLEDWQKFMKRLIKRVGPVRFYHCGEYGETTQRPHYHAILFGWRPPDPCLFSTSGEHPLYESPMLTSIWGLGHVTFGDLTFDTAAYVARYVTKKITGAIADDHYTHIDPETGEITWRKPEYSTMSRRPGIGKKWLEKYGRDTYDKDQVILNGRALTPPKAYDVAFEHIDPDRLMVVKNARLARAQARPKLPDRMLYNGQKIAKSRLQKRDL